MQTISVFLKTGLSFSVRLFSYSKFKFFPNVHVNNFTHARAYIRLSVVRLNCGILNQRRWFNELNEMKLEKRELYSKNGEWDERNSN